MKLLALPGLDGTGDLFHWFAREAPEGIAVKPVSYPPDRRSGVLDYATHLDMARRHLPDAEPFLLLGESFSGPVAVRLAAEAPPGLAGLVLCATFVRPPSWSGFRYLPWKTLFSRPVPRHVIRRRLAGPWISPEIVRAVREVSRKVDPAVRAARLRASLTVDARDALARVDVPILYLRGARDRLIPHRCLRAILALRPDVHVAEIDAPHMLLQIAPGEAWTAIERSLPVPKREAAMGSRGAP
jgi:pimeloyl-ACP methyl ester carboxylesterase